MPARPYRKLPGQRKGLLAASTLWEADDHLLLVNYYYVGESYQRLFFRDIQAFVITPSRARLVTTSIFALLAAIPAAFAIASEASLGVMLWILAGVFAICAVLAFFAVSACRCTVQTAVQSHRIPVAASVSRTRRTLEQLQAKILAAQQPTVP